jgi:hypothetical protein
MNTTFASAAPTCGCEEPIPFGGVPENPFYTEPAEFVRELRARTEASAVVT